MAIPAVPMRLFFMKSLLSVIFLCITGLDFWPVIYQFELKMSKILILFFAIFETRKINLK
jgi:hypothetical protein